MPLSCVILSHTVSKAQANTREKSERSRGGQVGHKIHKSVLNETLDKIVIKYLKKASLGVIQCIDVNNNTYYTTQMIDLQIKRFITETRYYISDKGKKLDKSVLLNHKINPVVHSPHFKAVIIYFN